MIKKLSGAFSLEQG